MNIKISLNDVCAYYRKSRVLTDVTLDIMDKGVTTFIGSSGCGKTTLLRCLNRMNDLIENFSINGRVFLDGKNIYSSKISSEKLRSQVGMVFQRPVPFPMSIYDNIAYAPRIHKMAFRKFELDYIVEESLKKAFLWKDVMYRLKDSALSLSGGQQQRLCIARAIAIKPQVILMDEPTSALDPVSTARIEELIDRLKKDYCIVIVTHSMSQAARISDRVCFLHEGRIIEYGSSEDIFTNPKNILTQDYITGCY